MEDDWERGSEFGGVGGLRPPVESGWQPRAEDIAREARAADPTDPGDGSVDEEHGVVELGTGWRVR